MADKFDIMTVMTISRSYCSLRWTHLQIMPNGLVYSCCESDHKTPYGDLRHTSLLEIWNSVQVKQLREMQNSGNWPTECLRCLHYEQSGGTSLRLRENEKWGYIQEAPEFPVSLDLRLDNTCNLKCRTCSPFYSTAWNSDFELLARASPISAQNGLDKAKILSDIIQMLPKIKRITFAGGEPLLSNFHFSILEKIAELELRDIELIYNTNLTILPEKILSIWRQQTNIYLRVSVDGIAEVGEFLRKGLKWEQFLGNAHLIKQKLPHVKIGVEYTMSVYNTFLVLETMEKLLDMGFINDLQDFNLGFVSEPSYLSAQIFNESEKLKLKSHFNSKLDRLRARFNLATIKQFEAMAQLALNYVAKDNLTNERLVFSLFHNKLSAIRSEQVENLFPELQGLFIKKAVRSHDEKNFS